MSFGVAMRNSVSLGLGGIPSLASGTRGSNPTINFNFALTQRLDPRITFTRASSARYYNGVTTAKAEENLLLQSQTLDNAAWTVDRTTVTANTVAAPDGTTTADTVQATLSTGTRTLRTLNGINIVSGLSYTTSIFAKRNTNNFLQITFFGSSEPLGLGRANFDLLNGVVGSVDGGTSTITDVGNGWYRCTYTVTAVATGTSFFYFGLITSATAARFESWTALGTESVYLWGAQLEQRSAVSAYTPTTTQPITNYIPVLLTAADNVARFDHNPVTSESLGLLIEEQRTNLVTYSDQFSNAAWTKNNSSITANTIVAPDGTLNADLLVENTANSTHIASSNSVSVLTATVYTYSLYAKANGRNWLNIQIGTGSEAYGALIPFAYFDLSTGSLGSFGNGTSSITPVGNGWYRCTLVAIATTAATTTNMRIKLASANMTDFYTGNGFSGACIFGAQVEAGAFPTSYIPTVASQVTRSADTAVMTGTNFSSWYNQAEGTMFGQAVRFGTGTTPTTTVFQTDDTTTSNRNGIFIAANGVAAGSSSLTAVGGVTQASATFTGSATSKIAYAYKTNDFATSFNASSPTLDTSGTLPAVTQARIGTNGSGFYNGHIQKIAYYPIRLSNTNLVALTS
jgi:hypothetical protein